MTLNVPHVLLTVGVVALAAGAVACGGGSADAGTRVGARDHSVPSAGGAATRLPSARVAAPASGGHRSDGVFVLARPFRFPQDVAMLSDGSVLVSNGESSASAPTWRLWPDGRRVRVAGFDATGFAVATDGGVLGVDGTSGVVRRWVPDGQPSIVAGGAVDESSGDGGPALAADLDLDSGYSHGIVPLPDGGFLFTESDPGRVRAVDPSGVIRTIVRSLDLPAGLAATGDGRFIVSDQDGLRAFRLDGSVKIIRKSDDLAQDLESLPDGSLLWSDTRGQLRRLAPGGTAPVSMMRSGAKRQWDFAGRSVDARGIAQTADGGLLIVGGGGIVYRPNGASAWPLVALRNTRIGSQSIEAVVETTQPGIAILELTRGRRVIARVQARVGRGHTMLRIAVRPSPRYHTLRARLRVPGLAMAQDQVPLFTARELTVQHAKDLTVAIEDDDPVERIYRSDRCRAFGTRRVDCEIRRETDDARGKTTDVCDSIQSLRLRQSGVILNRAYRCGDQPLGIFRQHPRWDLSSADGAYF